MRTRERFRSRTRRISHDASRAYAELSGDFNPIHLDEDYGARSEFGSMVVHGNLCLQLCFESLAEGLEGGAMPPDTQLRVRFVRPVLVDDEVTFVVTSATEQRGTLVVEGECMARGATVAAIVARIPWSE